MAQLKTLKVGRRKRPYHFVERSSIDRNLGIHEYLRQLSCGNSFLVTAEGEPELYKEAKGLYNRSYMYGYKLQCLQGFHWIMDP